MHLDGWKTPANRRKQPQQSQPTLRLITQVRGNQSDNGLRLQHYEVWQPVSELRLLAEDKSYLLGVINALQLSPTQSLYLLSQYADKWIQAMHQESHINRKNNAGRRAANQWILTGCQGFIERHIEEIT